MAATKKNNQHSTAELQPKNTTEQHGKTETKMAKLIYEELTYKIIGGAKEVCFELGSGYLVFNFGAHEFQMIPRIWG